MRDQRLGDDPVGAGEEQLLEVVRSFLRRGDDDDRQEVEPPFVAPLVLRAELGERAQPAVLRAPARSPRDRSPRRARPRQYPPLGHRLSRAIERRHDPCDVPHRSSASPRRIPASDGSSVTMRTTCFIGDRQSSSTPVASSSTFATGCPICFFASSLQSVSSSFARHERRLHARAVPERRSAERRTSGRASGCALPGCRL